MAEESPYELVVAGPAARALATQLPEGVEAAVIEFITGHLLRAPRRVGKPLHAELAGRWSARRGTYRILYTIDDDHLVVTVRTIEHRRDAYRPRDWRHDHVFVRSTTHQSGDEVTEQDIRLATRISAIAAAAGVRAAPTLARTMEIAVDSADPETLKSTWQTALGYRLGRSGDLVDPWGRGPTLWSQATETPPAAPRSC